jgi:hypothetical protein
MLANDVHHQPVRPPTRTARSGKLNAVRAEGYC